MTRTIHFFNSLLILFLASGFIVNGQTVTFSFTGGVQTYTVPPGVTCVTIDARGAAGGAAGPSGTLTPPSTPGKGGRTQATLTVVPGEVLNITVGGAGVDGDGITAPAGGYNGGGNAAIWPSVPTATGGGSGGGASDVQIAPYGITNRAVIAAGGGGAGYNGGCTPVDQPGGNGGGTTGVSAVTCTATLIGLGFTTVTPAGGGGTISGGAGGVLCCGGYASGTSGSLGAGGDNVDGGCAGCGGGIGGGGGGGYFGGGGGCWTGGGGGSSYVNPLITSGASYTTGFNSGNGLVLITPGVIPPPGAIVGPASICVGASGTFTNPTGIPVITWSSSFPAIATIGATTGVVTGITAGVDTIICIITTACGTISSQVLLTVNPLPAVITGPSNVCIANMITLSDLTGGGTWSSTFPAIGSVDVSGNVTGILAGNTTINYTVGGCTASHPVTVNNAPLPIVGPSNLCITSTGTYTDPTPGGVWSSSVPAAGAISVGGVLTPLVVGSSTDVIYTLGGCFVSQHVAFADTALQITGASSLCQGGTLSLVDGTPGGTWGTSAPGVATVSPSGIFGVVDAVGSGPVTISYTMPFCPSRTHLLTINPVPASITGSTAICVGLGTVLSDATPGGVWSSSNTLATVSPTGVVTCSVVGITDTIYYSILLTGCSTSAVVNTGSSPFGIYGDSAVCQGASTRLTDATINGVWSSTSLAIAQVIDSSGVVTGVSAGAVQISYTMPNGCYAVDSFRVLPPLPASVTVTGPANPVCSTFLDSFIAHPVNGGSPTYFWKKFDATILPAPGSGDTLKYYPLHGDVVMCYMVTSKICSVRDTVVDTFAINVYPDSVSPQVTIMTSHSDSIYYIGEIITFNANVTWGGTMPVYQWYVNGVPQPGATGSSFAVPVYSNDTIYCSVTGNPPCQGPIVAGLSNHIVIHAGYLGIKPLQSSGSLSLFPNPNTGNFTLSGAVDCNACKVVNYEVINVLGQVVYNGAAVPQKGAINEQISAGNLSAGSYMLRVNTETGNQTFHFVVAR